MNCTKETDWQWKMMIERAYSPRGPMVLPSTAPEAMAGAFSNWSLRVLEEGFQKRMSNSHRTHKHQHLHLQVHEQGSFFSVHHQNHVILIRQKSKWCSHSAILVTPIPAKLFPLYIVHGEETFWLNAIKTLCTRDEAKIGTARIRKLAIAANNLTWVWAPSVINLLRWSCERSVDSVPRES